MRDNSIFKTHTNIESLRNKLVIPLFLLLSMQKQISKEYRYLIKKSQTKLTRIS